MNNLKSWQPGTSGNPNGRPKGSRNIKSIIQDLLNDEATYKKLPITAPEGTQTPLEAIIYTLMIRSIEGDVRASDVLLKYAVDRDMPVEIDGFFSQNELRITVVDSNGDPYDHNSEIVGSQFATTPTDLEPAPAVTNS